MLLVPAILLSLVISVSRILHVCVSQLFITFVFHLHHLQHVAVILTFSVIILLIHGHGLVLRACSNLASKLLTRRCSTAIFLIISPIRISSRIELSVVSQFVICGYA